MAALGGVLACALMLGAAPFAASVQDAPVLLAAHRAIYDLSLAYTRGNSQIEAVRGRIVYDFDGNACSGYSLEFRQVSVVDDGNLAEFKRIAAARVAVEVINNTAAHCFDLRVAARIGEREVVNRPMRREQDRRVLHRRRERRGAEHESAGENAAQCGHGAMQ